ncbi:MAG: hypothetical protein KDC79_10060 [Cyclobacteriaceae bacterium]|nr:hypothetical protein [Cyclobacteriaceae bacterium]
MKKYLYTSIFLLLSTLSISQVPPPQRAPQSKPTVNSRQKEGNTIEQKAVVLKKKARQLESALNTKDTLQVEQLKESILMEMDKIIDQEKRAIDRERFEEQRNVDKNPIPHKALLDKTSDSLQNVESESNNASTKPNEKGGQIKESLPSWQEKMKKLSKQKQIRADFANYTFEFSESALQKNHSFIRRIDEFAQQMQQNNFTKTKSGKREEDEKLEEHEKEIEKRLQEKQPTLKKLTDKEN